MTHHAPTRFGDLNIGDRFRWPNGKVAWIKVSADHYRTADLISRYESWCPTTTRVIVLERAA